jgi:PLP dependent protein
VIELGALAERLQRVRQQIVDAGGAGVDVLAVTKGHSIEVVEAAHAVGLTEFGENYAQELVSKFANKVGDATADLAVHFIGQLQTNKVRLVVDLVDVYETLDRPALVTELAKRAPGAHVLVQVDTTGEPGKGGCAPGDVESLVAQAASAGLTVDGLMTVGPTAGGPEAARAGFRVVRALCDTLGVTTCSMGMSDDFIVAVQEGSTCVRLGSALFGMRPATTPRVR